MNKPVIRIVLFFAMYACVVVLPWWLSTWALILLTLYFPLYLEVMFFGFVFDTLYSVDYSFPYRGLTFATIFIILVLAARTQIRK
jgi:hypothetical protein